MNINTTPWIEKYRPDNFNKIILDEMNREIMLKMLETDQIPNMIFYGPPGTGKTTTIINFINDYQEVKNEKHKELVIHLNASDDRGIDIIRNKISTFTNSSYLFNKGTKFIVLDEVDYMTKSAQYALGKLIKENHPFVRFCLISNYISKIDKILQNVCMPFKFNTLPKNKISEFLENIVKKEKLPENIFNKSMLNDIISNFNSDVRSMINYIQGLSQTSSSSLNITHSIVTDDVVENLLNIIMIKPTQISEKYFIECFLKHNIEKQEFVIKLLNHITNKYMKKHLLIENKLIEFVRMILSIKNYYLDEFNIFFISKLALLLNEFE